MHLINLETKKRTMQKQWNGLNLRGFLYYCSHSLQDSIFGLIVSGYFWFGLFVRYCLVLMLAAVVYLLNFCGVVIICFSHAVITLLYGLMVSIQH